MIDVTDRTTKKKDGSVYCKFHDVKRDVYERELVETVTIKKKTVTKKQTKYYLDAIADD